MGSKAPFIAQIFFMNMQNKLKGPYTERQVQEYYEQEWFDGSTKFCFMTGDERPNEKTEYVTLDTLRSLNGVGCPFASISSKLITENKKDESDPLKKELGDRSKKCDEVEYREKYVESAEKRLKELSMQSPINEGNVVPAIDKKREDELRKFNEWTDYFADFYMTYVDALQTSDFRKIIRDHATAFSRANHIMKREEARLMCVEKIVEKLKMRDVLMCGLCEHLSFNYKQFLIHCADQGHIAVARIVVHLPNDCFGKTVATALRMMDDLRLRHASVRLDVSRLKPSKAFLRGIEQRYCQAMILRNMRSQSDETDAMNDIDLLQYCIISWKNEGHAERFMAELHEHIGTKLTYCAQCRVVTGTRDEYYRHLLLSSHNNMTDDSATASGFNFESVAVNMLKKDLDFSSP